MFYVVQIEPETGILLMKDGKRASGDAHWYSFDSQALAEAFCAERLRERPESGWGVFNDNRTTCLGEHTDRGYWASRSSSPKRSASLWQRLRARFTR
jgi:hypothetical protein